MDWEFDEDQKLSYNNPVFVELCKRQGKKFDELNTGWVPQHKIGEEPEEEERLRKEEEGRLRKEEEERLRREEEERIRKEDEDLDEDELFKDDAPKKEAPPKKEDTKDDKPKVKVDSPAVSMDDLTSLFGGSAPKTETPPAPPTGPVQPNFGAPTGPTQSNFGQSSNRERIGAALNQIPGQKPVIKLNIDKTTADQPIAPASKTTIKLKSKNPQ